MDAFAHSDDDSLESSAQRNSFISFSIVIQYFC